ncbi:hypothetical protein [Agromyces italicus]|uniref:hypothetical protein n=1 Tax=Agromyces italicus TaxID=279572 RepID=UPI00041D0F92|nr:hypothetical protein [Agromyces italicus]
MSPEIEVDAAGSAPFEAPSSGGALPVASGSPFTMLPGDAGAMVCEGDVCFVPGLSVE